MTGKVIVFLLIMGCFSGCSTKSEQELISEIDHVYLSNKEKNFTSLDGYIFKNKKSIKKLDLSKQENLVFYLATHCNCDAGVGEAIMEAILEDRPEIVTYLFGFSEQELKDMGFSKSRIHNFFSLREAWRIELGLGNGIGDVSGHRDMTRWRGALSTR